MPSLAARAWQVFREGGVRALASKIWNKLVFWRDLARMPYVRVLEIGDGETLHLHVNTPFSRQWYTHARAISPELRWIRGALRPGDIVADCGANNGFTAILFARTVTPGGRVIGFEPAPQNLKAARENIRLNGIDNVELVAAAVGASAGRIAFDPGFGNGAIAVAGSRGTLEVPQVTLDGHFGSGRVDLVKIDVEGHELDVLRGAQRVLRSRPALAIEIHTALYGDREGRLAELFGLFEASAYDAQVQLEVDGPLAAFDPAVHTPRLLARHSNVHWLGTPKSRGRQGSAPARSPAADSSR